MRPAFTLIELLVVIIIIAVVMGMVMPVGSQMLSSFERHADRLQGKHDLKLQQSRAFLGARELIAEEGDMSYRISKKGVVREVASRDHDR